jgi:hypothetical protein
VVTTTSKEILMTNIVNIYNMTAQEINDLSSEGRGAARLAFKAMHGVPLHIERKKMPTPPVYEGPVIPLYEAGGFTFKSLLTAEDVVDIINQSLDDAVSPSGRTCVDWDARDYAGGVSYSYNKDDIKKPTRATVTTTFYGEEKAIKEFTEKFKKYKQDKKDFEQTDELSDKDFIVESCFSDLLRAAYAICQTRTKLENNLKDYECVANGDRAIAIKFMDKAGLLSHDDGDIAFTEDMNLVTYAEKCAAQEFSIPLRGTSVKAVDSMLLVSQRAKNRLENAGIPMLEV